MPSNDSKHLPPQHPGTAGPGEGLDPLTEAENLRGQLQQALSGTLRLIASLKQHRRQSRAVESAMSALRRLHLGS